MRKPTILDRLPMSKALQRHVRVLTKTCMATAYTMETASKQCQGQASECFAGTSATKSVWSSGIHPPLLRFRSSITWLKAAPHGMLLGTVFLCRSHHFCDSHFTPHVRIECTPRAFLLCSLGFLALPVYFTRRILVIKNQAF